MNEAQISLVREDDFIVSERQRLVAHLLDDLNRERMKRDLSVEDVALRVNRHPEWTQRALSGDLPLTLDALILLARGVGVRLAAVTFGHIN